MRKKFLIGLGVGILLGGTGAYLIWGTRRGFKTRMRVKWWMLKIKGEVLEKLSQLEEVTQSAYMGVIDKVIKNYKNFKDVDSEELVQYAKHLKDSWKEMKEQTGYKNQEEGESEDEKE
jgi:gas vesicle protein